MDKMTREEAGYWLGMAVHRVYPRRVLAALRLLLTTHPIDEAMCDKWGHCCEQDSADDCCEEGGL